jgi:ATP-binding cassette subfamily B multidrug efflux pump
MTRLTRYLKPYLLMILLAVALLFVQANADLALPDYLSQIVNIGIQQGGVEHVIPEAIRQSQMERLLLFLNEDDAATVLEQYRLVDTKADGGVELQLLEQYPEVTNQPIYVARSISSDIREQLNRPMSQAWMVVSMIELMMNNPDQAAELMGDRGDSSAIFDLSKIPPGTDVFALLSMMPSAQLNKMTEAMSEQFAALGDSMVEQAAIRAVSAENEALGMDTTKLQSGYILRVGGQMLLLTLLSVVCTIAVGFLAARVSAGLARDLRKAVFEKVENFAQSEFDTFSTASLITRTTNDVTQVQMVTMMLVRMVIYAPIMGVGGVIRAMGKGSSMWWIIAVAVGVLLSLIVTVFSIALPKFKSIQKLVDRLNLVARENLSGMMVIRAFNMQTFEENRFDEANRNLTAVSLFVNRVMVIMMPMMMLVMNGLSLSIIWVGARQVADAAM